MEGVGVDGVSDLEREVEEVGHRVWMDICWCSGVYLGEMDE